jgi:hypothetical protein
MTPKYKQRHKNTEKKQAITTKENTVKEQLLQEKENSKGNSGNNVL